jgi:hypothetical protein
MRCAAIRELIASGLIYQYCSQNSNFGKVVLATIGAVCPTDHSHRFGSNPGSGQLAAEENLMERVLDRKPFQTRETSFRCQIRG